MIDYYKILGVSKTATFDQIKAAYRKLSKEHHPDTGGDAEKFKELSQAYEILSDPAKRSRFDDGEDPAKRGPSIKDQAHTNIIKVFNELLNNDLAMDRKKELADLYVAMHGDNEIKFIKELREVMRRDIQKLRMDGDTYKNAIKEYQKRLGIIERKSKGPNIFDAFMIDNIKVITGQRNKVAEAIKICRASIEILKDYEDRRPTKETKGLKDYIINPFTIGA